jgi:two-component sensor histidine kinase
VDYSIGTAPLAQAPTFVVAVGLPLGPILQASQAQFLQQIAFTSGVFLVAAALAFIGAYYWVHRPVAGLTKAADAIALGDLTARPDRGAAAPEVRALGHHMEKMATALAVRQSQLAAALAQKDILLQEMNHRVKNSLQLVASIFRLQAGQISDKTAREQFDQASGRISTIARVHQRLYHHDDVQTVDFGQFLREMCRDIGETLGAQEQEIACEADEARLPTYQSIPLALIANELVTNAFKYARLRPDESGKYASGHIVVSCHIVGAQVVLSVADGGAPLAALTGKGLGAQIIQGLVNQLRGRIDIERRPHGKAIVIRVPRSSQAPTSVAAATD